MQSLRVGVGVIPGVPVSVDYFRTDRDIKVHFLSHAHSDHYQGLSPTWASNDPQRTILCSKTTATLVTLRTKVAARAFQFVEAGKSYCVFVDKDRTKPIIVTAIDANHCAGALAFLFKVPDQNTAKCITRKIMQRRNADIVEYDLEEKELNFIHTVLYTGDFRFDRSIFDRDWMKVVGGQKVDCLYLDDTYLDPEMNFPPRCEVAQEIIDFIRKNQVFEKGMRIIMGMDTVGKEELLVHLAIEFNTKIVVAESRYEIVDVVLNNKEKLESLFTCNPEERNIFVIPKTDFTYDFVSKVNLKTPAIGILPSAFAWKQRLYGIKELYTNLDLVYHETHVNTELCLTRSHFTPSKPELIAGQIYAFPYSLHSSFPEICEFVQLLTPSRVIPITSKGDAMVNKHLGLFITSTFRNEESFSDSLKAVVSSEMINVSISLNSDSNRKEKNTRRDSVKFQFSSLTDDKVLESLFQEEAKDKSDLSHKRQKNLSENLEECDVHTFGGSCEEVFRLLNGRM
jgi:hypothetical protein